MRPAPPDMPGGVVLSTLGAALARDPQVVGGKAAALSRLVHARLPVPPGFVVPVGILHQADGSPRDDLTPEAQHAILAAAQRLGGPLAVRSSAVAEDGARRSFAGQHDTRLGVAPEDVLQAVRDVLQSLHTDRARVYRARDDAPRMAVLVQRQVHAATSGVMFTVNPWTGSWRELVIEGVRGLGEPLVAGHVTPSSWRVQRPRWLPPGPMRRLLRPRLTVVARHLVPQDVWWPAGATAEEPLPQGDRHAPTLDDDAVLALADVGLAIEAALGGPQDVEWAIDDAGVIHVVQARPITTTTPSPGAEPLWTRRFLGERWPEPATPMGWSLVEPVLTHLIAYPDTQASRLGGGPPLRLVEGRPYVNATVFRHLAFKVPGAEPPRFLMELLPPDEARSWRTRRGGLPDLAVYASLFAETARERRWERFAWNPATNLDDWRAFEPRLREAAAMAHRPITSTRDAVWRVEALSTTLRQYVGIHVASLLFANLTWQLLEATLHAIRPDRAAAWMADLAVSPSSNRTLAVNHALWELAGRATDGDLDRLSRGEPARPPFSEALEAFLQQHGHRALASWEVFSPRWGRDPSLLAPLLRHLQREPTDPLEAARDREARQARATDDLMRVAPWWSLPGVLGLVWYTRRYLLLRENQRYAFDDLMCGLQDTLLGLGARLADQGVLDAAADIAFLTWPEARLAVDQARCDVDVAARRLAWRRWHETAPPVDLIDQRDPPASASAPTSHLQGQPASAGRGRGRVTVLHSPTQAARLRPGDVLVVATLDPSWTPLLPGLAGAVVELGGALSHGAVIAREYGVPMVVDVPDATRRLLDGEEVSVDGSRGLVTRHAPPGPPSNR